MAAAPGSVGRVARLSDDDGARDAIAEPLIPLREEDQHDPESVEHDEIDDPEDVPDDRRLQVDRPAVSGFYHDAGQPLAHGLARSRLEADEVQPAHSEPDERGPAWSSKPVGVVLPVAIARP